MVKYNGDKVKCWRREWAAAEEYVSKADELTIDHPWANRENIPIGYIWTWFHLMCTTCNNSGLFLLLLDDWPVLEI